MAQRRQVKNRDQEIFKDSNVQSDSIIKIEVKSLGEMSREMRGILGKKDMKWIKKETRKIRDKIDRF